MTAAAKIQKTEAELALSSQFEASRESLPGNDWASGLREAAIGQFVELGLPHRRQEAWKYTDLRGLLKTAATPATGRLAAVSDQDLYQALGAELHGFSAHHIVFVDGVYDEGNSFIISDEAGLVFVTPLHELLAQPPDWLRSHLERADLAKGDSVAALNTAFMRDGAVIAIVKGAQLKRPVHLIHITSGATGEAVTERNFIKVEQGARACVLESYVHLRAPDALRNTVTEIDVLDGAYLEHIKFQHDGAKATHLGAWQVRLGAGSNYRAFQFTLGAALSRSNIDLRFVGEGARADVSGAALLWNEQHADTTLNIDHAVPGCTSRELYKYVLDDRARGVFQGRLVVRPDAQKTDAKQMARSLLLSEDAEFDAKPELEIYADDVACGHGATSGQLDEEQLFYMRQRGIPEEQARSLLVLAFIGEALELIANDGIRSAFQHAAEAWLGAEGKE